MAAINEDDRTKDLPMPLDEWRKKNIPEEKMRWRESAFAQFMFFDRLTDIIYPYVKDADYEVYKSLRPKVISTHWSKSIRLPVIELRTLGGIVFTIRHNFYDYKVSVDSPTEIDVNFYDLFYTGKKEPISSCYFEGFPDDRIFGAYDDNKQKFSVGIGKREEVYTFLWLIIRTTPA